MSNTIHTRKPSFKTTPLRLVAVSLALSFPLVISSGEVKAALLPIMIAMFLSIKTGKRLYGIWFLMLLNSFFLLNIITNLVHHGDSSWTAIQIHCLDIILFVLCCYKRNTLKPIATFLSTCNLWVVCSFVEVLVRFLNGYNETSEMFLLCGYDNGLGAYFLPIIALNLYFAAREIDNSLMRVGTVLAALQIFMVWSATAIVGIVFLLGIYYVRKNHFINKIATPLTLFVLGWAVFVFVVILRIYDNRFTRWVIQDILHKSLDFTGRTLAWDKAIIYIFRSPIIGHGRAAEYQKLIVFQGVNVTSAHNFYLDVLCQCGVIGICLLVIVLSFLVLQNMRKGDHWQRFVLNCLFLNIVTMQFESYCGYDGYPLFFLVLVFGMYCRGIDCDIPVRKVKRLNYWKRNALRIPVGDLPE